MRLSKPTISANLAAVASMSTDSTLHERREQLEWVRNLRQSQARWDEERTQILRHWQEVQENWMADKLMLEQQIEQLTQLGNDERECFVHELEECTHQKVAAEEALAAERRRVQQLERELGSAREEAARARSDWDAERTRLAAVVPVPRNESCMVVEQDVSANAADEECVPLPVKSVATHAVELNAASPPHAESLPAPESPQRISSPPSPAASGASSPLQSALTFSCIVEDGETPPSTSPSGPASVAIESAEAVPVSETPLPSSPVRMADLNTPTAAATPAAPSTETTQPLHIDDASPHDTSPPSSSSSSVPSVVSSAELLPLASSPLSIIPSASASLLVQSALSAAAAVPLPASASSVGAAIPIVLSSENRASAVSDAMAMLRQISALKQELNNIREHNSRVRSTIAIERVVPASPASDQI